MANPTPGPWKVGSEQLRGGLYWYVAIPGAEETIDLHESENGEANARLIAAATDMLEALKVIADWDKAPLTHEHPGPLLDVIRCICDRAREEITKATK